MSINEQSELLSQLSDEIKQFNEMLLFVSWKEADLVNCCFDNSLEIACNNLLNNHIYLINMVIKHIPEWKRLINCKQHKIHDFCLDIHTLLVLQNIQKHEDYPKLNNYEKLILIYSALLHDISKNENEVDPEHSIKGAKLSSSILYRLGFDENFINSVYLLIKHHQLLGLKISERLNLSCQEIAEIFKTNILFNLQLILSISDIKAVKKDGLFYSDGMNEKFEKLKIEVISLINKI